MKVKGTAIVDLIRIMRAEKGKNFAQHLEPKDIELAEGFISASQWYPGDSFWRIAYAVAKEVGQLQRENVKVFGRLSAQSYLEVYRMLVVPGDPAASLKRCVDLWDSFYDFEGEDFTPYEVETGDNWIRFKVYDYPTMPDRMRQPYFWGLEGYFLEIAERALGREIESETLDGGDFYEMTFRW